MVKIKCFGKFGLIVNDEFFDIQFFRSQKARELFKMLVAYKERKVSKEFIARSFWPGMEYTKSKQNMNSTIYFIREGLDSFFAKKGLGKDFIKSDSQFCWLILPEDFICDVDLLKKEIKSASYYGGEEKLNCLRKAVEIYEGDFIQEEYDVEWVKPFRKEYKELTVNAIKELIKHLESGGAEFEIGTYIAKLAEIDPDGELDFPANNRNKYEEKAYESKMNTFAAVVNEGYPAKVNSADGFISIVQKSKGAKFVDKKFFKDVVKLELNRRKSSCSIINVKNRKGNFTDMSEEFLGILAENLRSGDVISISEKNIFILLSSVDENQSVMIMDRLKKTIVNNFDNYPETGTDFRLFKITNSKIKKIEFENIDVRR